MALSCPARPERACCSAPTALLSYTERRIDVPTHEMSGSGSTNRRRLSALRATLRNAPGAQRVDTAVPHQAGLVRNLVSRDQSVPRASAVSSRGTRPLPPEWRVTGVLTRSRKLLQSRRPTRPRSRWVTNVGRCRGAWLDHGQAGEDASGRRRFAARRGSRRSVGCAPAHAVDVSRETRQWRRFRWTYEGFGCITADRSDGGGRVRSGACCAWCIGTGLSIVDASLEHQQRSARCAEASTADPFGWCDIGDDSHAYVCRRVMQRGGGLRCSHRLASGVHGRGSWCAGECISRRCFAEEHFSPYGTFAS